MRKHVTTNLAVVLFVSSEKIFLRKCWLYLPREWPQNTPQTEASLLRPRKCVPAGKTRRSLKGATPLKVDIPGTNSRYASTLRWSLGRREQTREILEAMLDVGYMHDFISRALAIVKWLHNILVVELTGHWETRHKGERIAL